MNQSTAIPIALRCPKCAGEMTTYERSGVHVDQCRECRGVFLDRGELERLMDLEAEAMAAARRGAPLGAGMPASAGMPAGAPVGPGTPAGGAPASWADPRWDPRYAHDDPRRGRYRDDDDDDDHWDRRGDRRGDDRYRGDDRGRSRKRSFLGELFEGFGD